jgi:hypothetical protein
MLERKDVSGFMLMRDKEEGTIALQVIAEGSENMSIYAIDIKGVDIAAMLDSLMPVLDVEDSLADNAISVINVADALDSATADNS